MSPWWTCGTAAHALQTAMTRYLNIPTQWRILTYCQFCYMCQNGGETLACDRCPRVVCYEHLPVVHTLPAETLAGVEFLCPACHIVDDRRGGRVRPYEVSKSRYRGSKTNFSTAGPIP